MTWLPLLAIPFILMFAGLAILAVIFWLWMLIDCLAKERFDDKLVWVLVIIFLHAIGAILYYFLVKSKAYTRRKQK